MSGDNGKPAKRCENCKHWANERSLNGPDGKAIIGSPHIGDCLAVLYPAFMGMSPQGPQIMPGGYYNITFEQSSCAAHYQPRLSALPNWGKKPQETEVVGAMKLEA